VKVGEVHIERGLPIEVRLSEHVSDAHAAVEEAQRLIAFG
jgi:hypothetical protein